ncbi:hypothetical protein NL676_034698 [Syzygium grande]|nr:hypothetical protein NL676_034698 [Syzygium grande]
MDGINLDPSNLGCFVALRRIPNSDIFEASRADNINHLKYLLETSVNVNARDRQWEWFVLDLDRDHFVDDLTWF